MRNVTWIALFRIIPELRQGKLFLVTKSGNEINMQSIYRLEDEFIVFRGRLAGTMDLGTPIMVPYDQIDYLGFREEIKEPDLQAMFTEGGAALPPPVAEDSRPAAAEPEAPAAPAAAPLAPAATPVAPSAPAAPAAPAAASMPGKAALLERLRRSRQGQGT